MGSEMQNLEKICFQDLKNTSGFGMRRVPIVWDNNLNNKFYGFGYKSLEGELYLGVRNYGIQTAPIKLRLWKPNINNDIKTIWFQMISELCSN